MKNIQVSDEDYKILMELSKELQTQDNNHQAFPYFWEPSSTKRKVNIHGEGKYTVIIHDCESYEPEELKNDDPELWKRFCIHDGYDGYNLDVDYDKHEREWIEFLDHVVDDYEVFTEDDEIIQEHNPSLFCSDVKNYVKYNRHHLGENPHTYSRTIQRMPKMTALVKAVLNFNKDVKESEINHEAKRFIK